MQQERRVQNQEVEDDFVSYAQETFHELKKIFKGKEKQVDRLISDELYVQTIVELLEDIFDQELENEVEQQLRQSLAEDMYQIKLNILNQIIYGQLVRNPDQTLNSVLERLLKGDSSVQEDVNRIIYEEAQEAVWIGYREANLSDEKEPSQCPYYEA